MYIPNEITAEVEDALRPYEGVHDENPLAVAQLYVAEVNDVAHVPVNHPPGTPIPLAMTSVSWHNNPHCSRVGVILDGHKLLADGCSVEHEIRDDEHGNLIDQRIRIGWDGITHYHATTPLRVEVRQTPWGFFLRMATTVIPCAAGPANSSGSVVALIEELIDALGDLPIVAITVGRILRGEA
jgi:hypothetical protein